MAADGKLADNLPSDAHPVKTPIQETNQNSSHANFHTQAVESKICQPTCDTQQPTCDTQQSLADMVTGLINENTSLFDQNKILKNKIEELESKVLIELHSVYKITQTGLMLWGNKEKLQKKHPSIFKHGADFELPEAMKELKNENKELKKNQDLLENRLEKVWTDLETEKKKEEEGAFYENKLCSDEVIQTMEKEKAELQEQMKVLQTQLQAVEKLQMQQASQCEVDNDILLVCQLSFAIKSHLKELESAGPEVQKRYEKIKKAVQFVESSKLTCQELKRMRIDKAHPELSQEKLKKALELLKVKGIVDREQAQRIANLIKIWQRSKEFKWQTKATAYKEEKIKNLQNLFEALKDVNSILQSDNINLKEELENNKQVLQDDDTLQTSIHKINILQKKLKAFEEMKDENKKLKKKQFILETKIEKVSSDLETEKKKKEEQRAFCENNLCSIEKQFENMNKVIQTMEKEKGELQEQIQSLQTQLQAVEKLQMPQASQCEVDNAILLVCQLSFAIYTELYKKVFLKTPTAGYCSSMNEFFEDMKTAGTEVQKRFKDIQKVVQFDESDELTCQKLKHMRIEKAHPELSQEKLEKALELLEVEGEVGQEQAQRIANLITMWLKLKELLI